MTIGGYIQGHQVISTGVAFWLASNAVGAMQSPDSSNGKFYKWAFTFLHALIGSLPRLLAVFQPQSKLGTYFQGLSTPPKG